MMSNNVLSFVNVMLFYPIAFEVYFATDKMFKMLFLLNIALAMSCRDSKQLRSILSEPSLILHLFLISW